MEYEEQEAAQLYSSEAEQSVLGAMMLNPEAFYSIGNLQADHFYFAVHRIIFEALSSLVKTSKPTDVISLASELDARGELENMGGLVFLGEIAQNTPSARNVTRYAEIVIERAQERQMLAASQDIAMLAVERTGRSLAERQADCHSLLTGILDSAASDARYEFDANEAVQSMIKQIMDRHERADGELGGLSSGLRRVDEVIDGFRGGQLVVIGGRTSMGKSVAAMQITHTNAAAGKRGRYFSLEMPAESLSLRVIAGRGSINQSNLKTARLTEEEYHRLTVASSWFGGLPLMIDTRSSLSVDQVAASARKQARRGGLDFIVVDHLHLMKVRGENRVQALAEASAGLKHLAMELNIPVFLVAQLNRESAKGGASRKPSLHDLRDSGAIEQDADIVILLHREGYYDPNSPQNTAEWIIAKNREGETMSVPCGWDGATARFTDTVQELCGTTPAAARPRVDQEADWL